MIDIESLYKIYNQNQSGEFCALNNINLKIQKNEFLVLKGVSGSGKSTLLSTISAITKPTSGRVTIDKEPITKLPEHHASKYRAENIGFIFQSFNLFETLTVRENIYIPMIPLELSSKIVSKRVDEVLSIANIYHKADHIVKDLSGGEKQRCAIARALANNPKLILCDEPTANLDRENINSFIDSLKELKSREKTIILATHDPIFESLDFVDRVVEIRDAKIV